ncbi:MAG: hypothetical protein D6688_13985 [Alphaproteobacteria bacterium]|nr:MAG: hypothetical protein D6688_13985 [Alphaproteobacteria bacterium]
MPARPLVGIVPYGTPLHRGIGELPLSALRWPLGGPATDDTRRVRDLGAGDHLLVYPKNGLYLRRRLGTRARISVMVVEPAAMHRRHLRALPWVHRRFFRILTRDAGLVRRVPNARLFLPGGSWIADPDKVDTTKIRPASIVASSKRGLPGHRLRHEVVALIRDRGLDVDVLGRGYRPFGATEEALAPYRFSVVIENSRENGYFSEKLIDALLCRTVPIYWGAPDVGEYFDAKGLIICNTLSDIGDALGDIGQEAYMTRLAAIEENRRRAMGYRDFERRAAELLLAEAARSD